MWGTILSSPSLVRAFSGMTEGERKALSLITTTGASAASAGAMKKARLPEAIAALRDGSPAPDWLVSLAGLLEKVKHNPLVWNNLEGVVDVLIERNGISQDDVSGLLGKALMTLEVDTTGMTFKDRIQTAINEITSRVEVCQNPESPTALCVCPKCSYSFGVNI